MGRMGRIDEDEDDDDERSSRVSRRQMIEKTSSRIDKGMDELSLGSSEDGSSVDGDEDLEERVCQQIASTFSSNKTLQGSVDDLVDKETVDLLKVCARFKYPTEDELRDKFVNFGPRKKDKVLVLDMDETLIHAKFLTNPDMERNDDGHFTIHLASHNSDDHVKVSVKMRPFLDNCLEHLAKMYEIAVFTAGE